MAYVIVLFILLLFVGTGLWKTYAFERRAGLESRPFSSWLGGNDED